jgi:hypothetical protein
MPADREREAVMVNRRWAWWWCVLAAWLAGCGGAAHPYEIEHGASGAASEPSGCDDLRACEAELRARAEELARALSSDSGVTQSFEAAPGGAPDCGGARRLRDRICELAEAICELERRNPDSAELEERCRSARESCDQARADVARTCE